MNGLPYYKAYPRDFFEGTRGMGFEIKAAYRLLLDLIYMHGGALSDEPRFIAGQMGCSVKRWNLIRSELIAIGKISVIDNSLRNLRADKEMEMLRRFQDKQSENASAPRKNKDLGLAMDKPKISHTESEPDTSKKEAKASYARPARFAEFWDVYPHRNGTKRKRGDAELKYAAAVKGGVSEQSIIDGAKRSALDRQVIDGFARDPVSWLNQRGWTDEIPDQPTEQRNGKPSGQGRLSAFIAGASSAPRMDSWPDSDPSQPLLARR